MDLISTLEQEEIKRLKKEVPDFSPGDTVIVNVNVVEGERKRSQAFEGMVIAKRNRGLNSSFIVRKISSGEGVERTFQTYSPLIASIEVKRKGDVRRAKLYYLRERVGRASRVRERRWTGLETDEVTEPGLVEAGAMPADDAPRPGEEELGEQVATEEPEEAGGEPDPPAESEATGDEPAQEPAEQPAAEQGDAPDVEAEPADDQAS